MNNKRDGFTLIELMIVVAIIGILATIAIPKFAELMRKSSEGASKGNLGSVRGALGIYYGDLEGVYPDRLSALTIGGRYLSAIPSAKTPNYHADTSVEGNGPASAADGAGGWWYDNVIGDANAGTLKVNCTHTDTKGTIWTTY